MVEINIIMLIRKLEFHNMTLRMQSQHSTVSLLFRNIQPYYQGFLNIAYNILDILKVRNIQIFSTISKQIKERKQG